MPTELRSADRITGVGRGTYIVGANDRDILRFPSLRRWYDAHPKWWRRSGNTVSWEDSIGDGLRLNSTGTTPPTGSGTTEADFALEFAGVNGLLMRPDNPADLSVDLNAFSLVFVIRPNPVVTQILIGAAVGAGTTADDLQPLIRLQNVGANTAAPSLLSGNLSNRHIDDAPGGLYAGARHIVMITFGSNHGTTMWLDGLLRSTQVADKRPLTDGRFQFGGSGTGAASINLNAGIFQKFVFSGIDLWDEQVSAQRTFIHRALGARHGIVVP